MPQYEFEREQSRPNPNRYETWQAHRLRNVRWYDECNKVVSMIHRCGYCGHEQELRGEVGAEGSWYCKCGHGLAVKIPVLSPEAKVVDTW